MNTRLISMSVIGVLGSSPMYRSARSALSRSAGWAKLAGSGTRLVTIVTCPGFVPHDTIGDSSAASMMTVASKTASGSVGSSFQRSTASSKASPWGAFALPRR